MLSGAVTKAVNHCHSISSYPYFHINTKPGLGAGSAAQKRDQHVLMLSGAGGCHQGLSGASAVSSPQQDLSPHWSCSAAPGSEYPKLFVSQGTLPAHPWKNSAPKGDWHMVVTQGEWMTLTAASACPGDRQRAARSSLSKLKSPSNPKGWAQNLNLMIRAGCTPRGKGKSLCTLELCSCCL